jgi:hypothetical protein
MAGAVNNVVWPVAKKRTSKGRSDQYRLDLAALLMQAAGDPLLNREQKLAFACSIIDGVLPIPLGLFTQIVDEVVAQLDAGPSLAGTAERIHPAVQHLMEIKLAAEPALRLDDDVSPAEERLEQYRSDLASLLRQFKRDRLLSREQKLLVVHSTIDNVLSILLRLCGQAADGPIAESDLGPALIGATKQVLATVKDLMELDRAFKASRRRTGRR